MSSKKETELHEIILRKDREISELKSTIKLFEEKLSSTDTQDFYENLIAKIPGNIYWMNTKNEFLGCNDQQAKLANLNNRHEIVGKTNFDMPWKEQAEELNKLNNLVMQTGKAIVQEEKAYMTNGYRIYLSHKVPLKNEKDEMIGILGISLDINDIKELEKKLAKEKIRAESANRAKSEFIANMSHDIRTPLAGIIGISNILEDEAENETIKEYAHMLNISGEQLLSLLNSVLDLVSAKSIDNKKLNLTTFSLSEMLNNIFELELPSLKLKEIDFKLNIAPDVPDSVISDKEKVYRILLNILSNAIKFTHNGHIKIQVEKVEAQHNKVTLRFNVIDTGIGIPKEDVHKVFDQFYRASSSFESNFDGYGVGLHIVRKYLDKLQGQVDINSEKNKGTTISLTIPMNKATDVEKEELGEKIVLPQKEFDALTTIEPSQEDAFTLLVEDNFIARKIALDILSKCGCRVMVAETSTKAFKLCKENRFDFILSDIGLPDFSGLELARKIHGYEEKNKLSKTPIIGISAHARDEEINDAIKHGMIDLKEKPLKVGLVERLIHKYGYQKSLSGNSLKRATNSPKKAQNVSKADIYAADLPKDENELFKLSAFPVLDVEKGIETTGSEDMLKQMIELMLNKTLKSDLNELADAHQNKDWEKAQKMAHKIKGGIVYVGAIKLKMACQYLERYYKAGNRNHLEKLYEQVMNVSNETISEFKNYLNPENKIIN